MRRAIARAVATGIGVVVGLGGAPLAAQSASRTTPTVLDVPYVPQSELLCGGAAVAMVERWWGRHGVAAEDFAALVRPELGGIRTTDLAAAVRARGWITRVFDGTPDAVQRALADGRPVVVLMQVGRDRYHFVVVLGWAEGRVTFHDPAIDPSRVMDEARFVRAWDAASRWAMVFQPDPSARPATTDSVPSAPATPMPCAPWLDRALDAAGRGQLDEASRLLAEARRACPAEPVVLRELAAVRFKQTRYAEADTLAAAYVAEASTDAHGWDLLAASRYLAGDRDGALNAWNHVGRPTVDLVRIAGLRHVRFREVAAAMAIPAGTVFTPSRLGRARRRVAELPAFRRAAVDYRPIDDGMVEVQANVAERPLVERPERLLIAGAVRAAAQGEVTIDIASPTGAGELVTGTARWIAARPRAAFRLDMPFRVGLPGVLGLEGAWDRYRMALDSTGAALSNETRRSATVTFGAWATANVRPSVGVRYERWSGARDYLAAFAGTEFRAAGDRLALRASAEHGFSLSATTPPSYGRAAARALWASSLGLGRAAWSVRLGVDAVSSQTPLGAWPVAGSNLAWAIPLRAHTWTDDGRLAARSVGRVMAHGGLSGDHPIYRMGPIVIAAGLFLDGARIAMPADASRSRFYLDAGGGLRVGIADGRLGVVRIDVARGVADRQSAFTVGVQRAWPVFAEGGW